MPRQVKRPLIFTGENPGLSLFRPGSGELVAAASYWRCVYSSHGEGNALLIWVDHAGSGIGDLSPHAIYTDNPGVARLVAERFTQHFPNFRDHGFGDMEPTHARFFQESDSRWYHRVVANHGATAAILRTVASASASPSPFSTPTSKTNPRSIFPTNSPATRTSARVTR